MMLFSKTLCACLLEFAVLACDSKVPTISQQETPKTNQETPKIKIDSNTVADIKTNLGTIEIRFFLDKAPKTVKNFIDLAEKGFYDKTKFHRVIPGFMIQGGDPLSKGDDRSVMGTGGPGYSIDAEFNDVSHVRGIVSMARSQDPNSAGSQFFIVQKDSPFLDHQYTAFGQVVSGLDVIDKIVNLPRDARDNPKDANPAIVESITIKEGDPKKFPKVPLTQ